jgi:hypothetical protein
MHVIKPLEDIKADLILDIKEGMPAFWYIGNAMSAIRGSYGINPKESIKLIGQWIKEANRG